MKIESDILKTGLVVALLVGVYGGVVFWPGQKQNKALADEVQTKQRQLQSAQLPDLAPVREQIVALRAELRERSVELPVDDLHHRVLAHVSDTLLGRGVTTYDTSYSEPEFFKRFAVTPIEVNFDAGFTDAFAIIRRIESGGPPVRIEALQINARRGDTAGDVEVSMQMSSFFLPADGEGGGR